MSFPSRLYYSDSFLTEFDATVTSIDGPRVVLDRTAFYPTSGGQPHDTGTLGDAQVIDVIDGDEIIHVLAAPASFAIGAAVAGRIDWPRRHDHMQQHTGQHLLSAIFEDLFGHKTVSVHFGDATSTLEVDADSLDHARVLRAEARANEVVLENRPVIVTMEDAASVTGLRKPSDRAGEVRVVSIDGVDRSACGGTHVRETSGIGPVAIRRVEKYKRNTRVEFVCGARALARSRADLDALASIAAAMTAGIDELAPLLAAQGERLRAAEGEVRKLAAELAGFRARDLHAAAAPGGDGLRRITERSATPDDVRALAQAMAALPKVLFAGVMPGPPPAIVFAASGDSGVDAGAALKAALAAEGGRGGGSPRVAQGSVADSPALERVVAAVLHHA